MLYQRSLHYLFNDLYYILFIIIFMIYSPQGGLDGGDKDDLDSGDENEGRKIDTEEVVIQNGYIRQVL